MYLYLPSISSYSLTNSQAHSSNYAQVEQVASLASLESGGVLEHRADVFGIGYDASGRDDQDVKGTRTEESVHDKGVVRSSGSIDVEPLRLRTDVRRTPHVFSF